MNNIRYPYMILIILLITGLFMAGCSGGKEAEKKPAPGSSKADLPASIKSICSELDSLIPQLEQTAWIFSECQVEQEAGGDSGESSSGEGSQSQQKSTSGEEQSAGSKTQDTWSSINESVKKIHQSWNEAEAEAVQEGLSTDTRDKFEQALEKLTIETNDKNIGESVFAALEVYRYYPDMVDLFNSKIPAEFYRLKYEVMLIRAESGRLKWEQASVELPNLKAQWDILKKSEAIKEEDISIKTENSLNDLENAVEKQEACLVDIKSEIVMKNMDAIEQKLNSSM